MDIPANIKLVSTEVVATHRGCNRAVIYAEVEGGGEADWLWVWNVAAQPGRERLLRFWRQEVMAPATTRTLALPAVIEQLVPQRNLPGQYCGLRAAEVGELLRVQRGTLQALAAELRMENHNGGRYAPRAALVEFFTRRWVLAGLQNPIQNKLF